MTPVGFDHRVMDGAVIARAMGDLETILNGPVATEIGAPAAEAPTRALSALS